MLTPVVLLPGFANACTNPEPTISSVMDRIGIAVVACCVARVAASPAHKMTSVPDLAISLAISGNWSIRSPNPRPSTVKLWPSTNPSRCSSSKNAIRCGVLRGLLVISGAIRQPLPTMPFNAISPRREIEAQPSQSSSAGARRIDMRRNSTSDVTLPQRVHLNAARPCPSGMLAFRRSIAQTRRIAIQARMGSPMLDKIKSQRPLIGNAPRGATVSCA